MRVLLEIFEEVRMLDMGEYWVPGELHWKFRGVWVDKTRNLRFISMPNHPQVRTTGSIREHRLVCEDVLGRILKLTETIHHINGDTLDNRNCNLVLCENNSYHTMLHKRQRALESCGNANWLICMYCKEYDDPKNMKIYKIPKTGANRALHKECRNKKRISDYHKLKGKKQCLTF